jgi:hypothetical protein
MMDELLDLARQQLEQAKCALARLGLEYFELDPFLIGVGVGVAFAPTDFVVVSVSAGGSESMLNFASGVLRDLPRNRPKILDVCNEITRNNPTFPHFLHDAEAGWDVLVQLRLPATVMYGAPRFMRTIVENLPVAAQQSREKLAAAGVEGRPYSWNATEVTHLLQRSLM